VADLEQAQAKVDGRPRFSVVVAIVSDTTDSADTSHLVPCLEALLSQAWSAHVGDHRARFTRLCRIAEAQGRYPQVKFLKGDRPEDVHGRKNSREHHDELRARGLAVAQGTLVALIEDCGIAAKDWVARMVEAHPATDGRAGGAMENGIDRH